ncbi:MAG: ankyrin repeat domain-containing protein [Epsilonproteobacteria bacterium]|nr:ankyrin repeat domain-containing protein [Campylobacterota bacterium]
MTQRMTDIIPTQSDRLLEMAQDRLMLEEFLVQNANINVRDTHGKNALFWTIKTSHKHNTNLLLTYGISLMVRPEYHALFHTILSNDLETFILLLELGEDIDMRNEENQTLLMTAVQEENVMMVRYLINHGINLYAEDIHGQTALDYAKKAKNPMVFDLVHYRILYEKMQDKIVA